MDKPIILTVDDNKLNIDMLLAMLTKNYRIRIARNGEECIRRSMVEPLPDLILLDIMMPVMDGFETIRELKKNDKTKNIPVIFLTALDSKDDIAEGFKLGAVDYLTKPFNFIELEARIKNHLELKINREKIEQQNIELRNLNVRLAETLKDQKKYITKAKTLQRNMIQKSLPLLSGAALQALYLPCEQLGGDFFSIIKGIHNKLLAIIIGDCTGHGLMASIEASLLTSIVQKHLSILFDSRDTASFLTRVNHDFIMVAEEDKFPTVFVCLYDPESSELRYSNANGVLPSVLRDGNIINIAPAGGMHIGYSDDTVFEGRSFGLCNGDRIYFYSDAVLEHNAGRLNRIDRVTFEQFLLRERKNPSKEFGEIISAIEKTAGSLPLNDDTTFIQLDIGGVYSREFCFSTLSEQDQLLSEIAAVLESKDFSGDETSRISIGLDELCLNAYYHGNKEDTSKQVKVEAEISYSNASFRITDMGCGFNPEAVADPVACLEEIYANGDPDEYMHGRGILIANKFFDTVKYNETGNSVEVTRQKQNRNVIFFH